MNKEEIFERMRLCEKKEREFLEVGNTKIANRYHNEIQKWEELLNQLNPKMEKELNEYRQGYYKQKEIVDRAIKTLYKIIYDLENHEDALPPTKEELCKVFNILKEVII